MKNNILFILLSKSITLFSCSKLAYVPVSNLIYIIQKRIY